MLLTKIKKVFVKKNRNTNNTSNIVQNIKNEYERVDRIAWERGFKDSITL